MRAVILVATCVLGVLGCGSGMAGGGGGDDGGDVDAAVGGACTAAPPDATGEATYYAANGTGNCSFDASPGDLMVGAMNATDYGTADWCGGCVEVQGPKGTVTVRIVDQCPGCSKGDIDLSEEAFAKISPLSAGRVAITWHEVACNVTGPIAYHWKDGANASWAAIQIRNHRYPIASVEATDKNGAFQTMGRVEYNYFIESTGLGAGPYSIRVTDTRGHVIDDTNIALGDDVTRTGGSQFPVCP